MRENKNGGAVVSSHVLSGVSTDCTTDIFGEVDDDVHRMKSGWWLLPSAVLGAVGWFFIIRFAWLWLS